MQTFAKGITLSQNWRLAIDPEQIGKQARFAEAIIPSAKPAPVPGTIQQVYPTYEGVLWYYHEIQRLPQCEASERMHLCFGNVDYYCEVYLDGTLLGSHEGANQPFSFDITENVHEGSLLAVRLIVPEWGEAIDGLRLPEIPHSNKGGGEYPIGGQYNYGGIYEPVELRALPAIRIDDVFVRADIHTGEVELEITLENDTDGTAIGKLSAEIAQGSEEVPILLGRLDESLPVGRCVKRMTLRVDNPRLWDIEDPNLYRLELFLSTEGCSQSRYTTRFGFREFKVENGFFYLNGRRIFLKSTHTASTYPETAGGVTPPGLESFAYRDFQLLKASGFNCVRYIASQPTVRQLEYCDALGLMVYEENFASWYLDHDPTPRTKTLFNQTWEATIRRDRNHPCIVIWGLLNETFKTAAHEAAVEILPSLRTWDDTRLVLLSSGKFVKDFTLGCLANPGSTVWEHQWGDDGSGKTEGSIGDYHIYPRFPHGDSGKWILREYCKDTKPAFISEYGVASLMDVETVCRNYERRGVDPMAPDRRLIERIREKYEVAFEKYGMGRMYAAPVDFLKESERYNAKSRREGFDLIRANSRFCGYNVTGALDHAISGEGPITIYRDFKKDNFDVFAEGWADLRWSLFVERGHVYCGDPFTVEAVLASMDVLKEGSYTALFAITDENGMPYWKHEVTFALPVLDREGLPMTAVPIMKEVVSVSGKAGKYYLRAYLKNGGAPAAYEKEFFLSEKPSDILPKTIGCLGVSRAAIAFLTEHGVTVSEDLDACDTILVGALHAQGAVDPAPYVQWWDPSLGQHKQFCDATKQVSQRLMKLCEQGKTVIFGESFYLHNHDDDHTTDYLDALGIPDLDIFLSPDWLYHKDNAILPHPFTEGVKHGFLDWDWYWGCQPVDCIVTEAEADCAVAFFYVGGPIWCKPYHEMLGGHILARFKRGKGDFVISALPILQNTGRSPAGDRILLNLLKSIED